VLRHHPQRLDRDTDLSSRHELRFEDPDAEVRIGLNIDR